MNAKLRQAKAEADRARTELHATLAALQQRLTPGSLANDAWSGVKDKGGEIADGAVEAVKSRPAATAGVIAAGLLFLARRPIVAAASRVVRSKPGKKRKKGED